MLPLWVTGARGSITVLVEVICTSAPWQKHRVCARKELQGGHQPKADTHTHTHPPSSQGLRAPADDELGVSKTP